MKYGPNFWKPNFLVTIISIIKSLLFVVLGLKPGLAHSRQALSYWTTPSALPMRYQTQAPLYLFVSGDSRQFCISGCAQVTFSGTLSTYT